MSEPGRCADVGDWNPTRCVACNADLGPARSKRINWRAWATVSGPVSACSSHTIDEIRSATMSIDAIAAVTDPEYAVAGDPLFDPKIIAEGTSASYLEWAAVVDEVARKHAEQANPVMPKVIATGASANLASGRCTNVGDSVFVWCAVCNVGLGRRRPWRFVPTMSLSGRVAVCNSHTAEEIRGVVGPDRSADSREALQASAAKVDPVLHLALTWVKFGALTVDGDWRNRRIHCYGRRVSDLTELAVNGMHETYVTISRRGDVRLTDAGAELLAKWDAQVMGEPS